MIQICKRLKQSETGATAIEFSLVALMAITIFLGIIEFGRGLYMRNEMSYAVDIAARKILTNPVVAESELETLIRDAITFGASNDLAVSFGTVTIDGTPFRSLFVSYPVTLLIPNLNNGNFTLSINRRVPLT
ncbi:MAG: pilus assembly protein [Loktanella sp.]|nr:pilus assembly protein [Loktanella sp.]